MTRAQALKLLGLSSESTEAEIRRKYKKLALKYHPDVNPDPLAHDQFIQLTRAVEVLLYAEEEKVEPVRTSRKSTGTESPDEIKERLRQAKERFERQKAYKVAENNRYYEHLTSGWRWKIFRTIAIFGCICAVCLAFESILPHHSENDELLAFSKSTYQGILKRNITAIELKNRGIYFMHFNSGVWATTYPEVIIETTWFSHTPLYMYNTDDFRYYRSDFDFHSGSIQWGLVLLFLIPIFTWWQRTKSLAFVILYHFSFWMIGISLCYFLMTQNRLIHLLSLGFI